MSIDATHDLGSAPFARARRGAVTIDLPQIGVQVDDAVRIVGFSADVLLDVPFTVLPFTRLGRRRWYLVRHLNDFAERLMALRIARGEPRHMESLADLIRDLLPPRATP